MKTLALTVVFVCLSGCISNKGSPKAPPAKAEQVMAQPEAKTQSGIAEKIQLLEADRARILAALQASGLKSVDELKDNPNALQLSEDLYFAEQQLDELKKKEAEKVVVQGKRERSVETSIGVEESTQKALESFQTWRKSLDEKLKSSEEDSKKQLARAEQKYKDQYQRQLDAETKRQLAWYQERIAEERSKAGSTAKQSEQQLLTKVQKLQEDYQKLTNTYEELLAAERKKIEFFANAVQCGDDEKKQLQEDKQRAEARARHAETRAQIAETRTQPTQRTTPQSSSRTVQLCNKTLFKVIYALNIDGAGFIFYSTDANTSVYITVNRSLEIKYADALPYTQAYQFTLIGNHYDLAMANNHLVLIKH